MVNMHAFAGAEPKGYQHTFQLTPRICVLEDDEQACNERVHIEWHMDSARSVCLYRTADNERLKCWQNASHGEWFVDIQALESVEFELRELNSTSVVVLAREEFKVLRDVKKYRRSRRNPWSFF